MTEPRCDHRRLLPLTTAAVWAFMLLRYRVQTRCYLHPLDVVEVEAVLRDKRRRRHVLRVYGMHHDGITEQLSAVASAARIAPQVSAHDLRAAVQYAADEHPGRITIESVGR